MAVKGDEGNVQSMRGKRAGREQVACRSRAELRGFAWESRINAKVCEGGGQEYEVRKGDGFERVR